MRSLFKSLLVAIFLPLISNGFAATPDAGSIMQQLEQERLMAPKQLKMPVKPVVQPEKEESDALKVLIKDFEFRGNVNIPSDELREAFASYLNRKHSFKALTKMVRMMGEYYRGKGLWAKAIIPEQTFENGILIIQVIEGKLGVINIEHAEKTLNISEESAKKYLTHNQQQDAIFNIKAFEKAIKALDSVPGITAAAVLRPGVEVGYTDAVIKMANTPLTTGSARVDNFAGRSTSWEGLRFTGNLNIDGALKLGEQFNLQVVKSKGTDVYTFGASYPIGYDGSRIGVNYTDMSYHLGEPLQAIKGEGNSQTASAYFNKPLWQDGADSLSAQLQMFKKDYFNKTIAGISSDKSIKSVAGTLAFRWSEQLIGVATNNASVTYTVGDLDLSGNATDLANDAATAKANGAFQKVGLTYTRSQSLNESNEIWMSFLSQYAFKNLDSAEKISLGGSSGVRAFPGGEATGDHGAILKFELRHQLQEGLTGVVFYDHGWVQQHETTWTSSSVPNQYDLNGLGVGARWMANKTTELTANLATRLVSNPAADSAGNDGDGTRYAPRLWISVVSQF